MFYGVRLPRNEIIKEILHSKDLMKKNIRKNESELLVARDRTHSS
jgi:hypothetical protein